MEEDSNRTLESSRGHILHLHLHLAPREPGTHLPQVPGPWSATTVH